VAVEVVHLDVDGLAARWNTTAKVVYSMRYDKRLPPALRIGKQLRWRVSDIEAFEAELLELDPR
jgi:predicted DNA-binding transcriptional regulator AlpA